MTARRRSPTARQFRPDLILLDIVMPKVDGGDVARQIAATRS
jgi:CheY-like chemotaxis protein